MGNRDKAAWDTAKKTTPQPEPAEHSTPCRACGGRSGSEPPERRCSRDRPSRDVGQFQSCSSLGCGWCRCAWCLGLIRDFPLPLVGEHLKWLAVFIKHVGVAGRQTLLR